MYLQISAFVFGFLSGASVMVTCFWNQWAISSAGASASLLNSIWAFRGIWSSCMQYSTGQYQCEQDMTAMFDIPGYLIAIRAFMCTAIVLCTVACFTTLVGLQCSKVLEESLSRKRQLMFASGFMHTAAGILTLASVAWYTAMIVREFFSFLSQDNTFRYEMGGTVYVGYFSALLSFIASLCCFCMPGPKDDKDKEANYITSYSYKKDRDNSFVVKQPLTEYV